MVKISLTKNFIIGGLVAILGCSEDNQAGISAKQDKPNTSIQEKQSNPANPQEPKPDSNVTTVTKLVTLYDNRLMGYNESVSVDVALSDLCKKYDYHLSMLPYNWKEEKQKYGINDSDESMILIHHYNKDKTATEVERYPVADRKQIASRLEKELQYHAQGKGKPPSGCREYKKE